MISVAICDDCKNDVIKMRNAVANFSKKEIVVSTFSRGKDLLESDKRFDIVFLDIDLLDENGIEVGNKIKEKFYQTIIIYVTNYNSYYAEAFSVHAYQYILKPIEETVITKVLEESVGYITNKRSQNLICLDINNEKIDLELRDIIYFEFMDRKIKVVSKNGIIYLRSSLKYIYDSIKENDFGMPHKAFIVNYFYVKGIKNKEVLLVNADTIPMAQKRSAIFRKGFYEFLYKVYYVL